MQDDLTNKILQAYFLKGAELNGHSFTEHKTKIKPAENCKVTNLQRLRRKNKADK